MKRIILITALIGSSNLFAQTQSDSLLIKQISAIQTTIEKQKQEIEKVLETIAQALQTQREELLDKLEYELANVNNWNGKFTDIETMDNVYKIINQLRQQQVSKLVKKHEKSLKYLQDK